jgi:CheY-like chemotaxis protein
MENLHEQDSAPSGLGSVVLVDDDPAVLRAFERALVGGSLKLETFSSGLEAIQRVSAGGVQVVVSDITMPWMTGVELLRSIRECDPDLPVILVTGNPTVESAASAVEYGAFKYVMKPVSPHALRDAVAQAAQLHQLAGMKRRALELSGRPAGAGDRAGLETSFERALSSLWMAFQPIVDANHRTVYGYEALLRSDEPLLPTPDRVIDAASRLRPREWPSRSNGRSCVGRRSGIDKVVSA